MPFISQQIGAVADGLGVVVDVPSSREAAVENIERYNGVIVKVGLTDVDMELILFPAVVVGREDVVLLTFPK